MADSLAHPALPCGDACGDSNLPAHWCVRPTYPSSQSYHQLVGVSQRSTSVGANAADLRISSLAILSQILDTFGRTPLWAVWPLQLWAVRNESLCTYGIRRICRSQTNPPPWSRRW